MANKKGCTACSTVLDMFLHTLNTGIIKFSNISMKKFATNPGPDILKTIFMGGMDRNGVGGWEYCGNFMGDMGMESISRNE